MKSVIFLVLCVYLAHCAVPVTLNWVGETTFANSAAITSSSANCVSNTGITWDSFEIIREASIDFFSSQFGIPSENATLDPSTNITTIPGYGVVNPICMGNYILQASNLQDLSNWIKDKRLYILSFIFEFNSTSTVNYGGRFKNLVTATGDRSYMKDGDALIYGYYILQGPSAGKMAILKRIQLKSQFPSQGEWSWQKIDNLDLYDQQWGIGSGTCRFSMYPSVGGITMRTNLFWTFPGEKDFYTIYGV